LPDFGSDCLIGKLDGGVTGACLPVLVSQGSEIGGVLLVVGID